MKRLVIAGILFASAAAHAGGRDFVVARSGQGGTTESASAYIDAFLKYAEGKLGWPAGAVAKFHPDRDSALKFIAAQKPGFGILDPSLWLELRKSEALEVVATIVSDNTVIGHYSVLVKDPTVKSLEDLKGKLLISNHLQSPVYISKVAFDGKLDAATFFKLQPTASPLKGLKAVDRGEAAATIVDDRQLAQMKTLPFAQGLRVLYTSPAIPPAPLVAFTKNASAEDRQKIAKFLFSMCGDPKGAEVCKTIEVNKFTPPDKAVYDDAVKRYEKK